MHPVVKAVTQRIKQRSERTRDAYLACMARQHAAGKPRTRLSCGNLAHVAAAGSTRQQAVLLEPGGLNMAIITAYNDMLSAHEPYRDYPDQIKQRLAQLGQSGQVAGGVPAMCDGITQGQPGMELSLFSRDVIAQATAVAMSHNAFDGMLLLGVCDKIAPGQLIGALAFGHLPALFIPSGPMSSGISNREKVKVRQQYAEHRVDKTALQAVECRSYHSCGTCTFYGTANSNQLVFEAMGLMLPGSAFVHPLSPLRRALTDYASELIVSQVMGATNYLPLHALVSEKNIVNGIVALLASGGSTNHTIHLIAIARAAGLIVTWDDFSQLSDVVPLLSRIYPNGPEDINAFHQAGGTPLLLKLLAERELVHTDTRSCVGGFEAQLTFPHWADQQLSWQPVTDSTNPEVIAPRAHAFLDFGGLKVLSGNLGRAVMKVSAVAPEHWRIEAPAMVFDSQQAVEAAYFSGALFKDVVVVVRFSGPAANGMPELHKLIPLLSSIQQRGFQVALVTDGRLSGASGKVPAALHVCPEAKLGGMLAYLQSGDHLVLDARAGVLKVQECLSGRTPAILLEDESQADWGRGLFLGFREQVSSAESGASVLFPEI
ncbi:phosphogluconate dehydratase [Celerinatantimonas sp. YJH-8]|uniref:phosphogluconate dehydratase n=1 Tax=Celerinatantimonas sp. YJH-8 TaxID=3228714 RepID=UPI0038BECA12